MTEPLSARDIFTEALAARKAAFDWTKQAEAADREALEAESAYEDAEDEAYLRFIAQGDGVTTAERRARREVRPLRDAYRAAQFKKKRAESVSRVFTKLFEAYRAAGDLANRELKTTDWGGP